MRLVYLYPPNPPQEFVSETTSIVFGRSPGHPIDLDLTPDNQISRRHAHLIYENEQYWIEDLGSKRGTWVNGQRIEAKMLVRPGDTIKIGQTNIQVQEETVFQTATELVTLGNIGYTIDASQTPFVTPSLPDLADAVAQAHYQLKAFYELTQTLGTATTLEQLLQLFVEKVQQAIPGAQHGAVLLQDNQGDLLLKAHWPPGRHFLSRTWAEQAMQKQEAFLWTERNSHLPDSLVHFHIRSAIYAPLLCGNQVLGVVYVDNHGSQTALSTADVELLSASSNQLGILIKNHLLQQELQHEATIRSNLLRQFSPKVADRLMQKHGRAWPGGERMKPVTVLYSDVRDFTALCAQMEPDDVVQMLNEMFNAFVPIIFHYGGTVDKYVGDAVLAVFGSPEPDPKKQWENAVRAAAEMQKVVQQLGYRWQTQHLPVFEIGIGIHSGEVLHGFVGATECMEYTVIGDTVNRATRYCNGADRGEVIISPAVLEHVYNLVEVAQKRIRGKHPETEPELEAYILKKIR